MNIYILVHRFWENVSIIRIFGDSFCETNVINACKINTFPNFFLICNNNTFSVINNHFNNNILIKFK